MFIDSPSGGDCFSAFVSDYWVEIGRGAEAVEVISRACAAGVFTLMIFIALPRQQGKINYKRTAQHMSMEASVPGIKRGCTQSGR